MKMKTKYVISILVVALFILTVANTSAKLTTKGNVEQHLDASVISSYYVNPENDQIYLTSANVQFKFRAWSDLGTGSTKVVRIYDASNMRFNLDYELNSDGTLTVALSDIIADANNPMAFYEDTRIIQYTGLDSQGVPTVWGQTNFKIEGTDLETTVIRVDSKAPHLNYWQIKQNFWGGKTTLVVEANDQQGIESNWQTVSGLQYVRVYVPGFSIDAIDFVIFDSKEENVALHAGSKAWVGKFDLYDNLLHKILCSGFVVETQDWAGHEPQLDYVSPEEIEIQEPTFKFLQHSNVMFLLQKIMNRFPLLG